MNKSFRFVSMYVGDFDCLKHQLLQFCSDYKTSILRSTGDVLRLKVEHRQVLPGDFFSLGEGNEDSGCINSVSAIIGKNGSGKTTLARLLCNLPASDDRKPNWKVVLIYELNGLIRAYSTFHKVEINKGLVECEVAPSFNWPYRFFYYSPHFTTEQFDTYTNGYHADRQTREEGQIVSDISTTWLMLHPEGNSELLLHGESLQSSIFDADEKIRLFEFISDWHEKIKSDKFAIPMPSAISIGIHSEGFESAIRDFTDKVESCKRDEAGVQKKIYSTMKSSPDGLGDPVGEYLRALIEPFGNFRERCSEYGLVAGVFMSYAARYIQECGMLNPSFPVKLLQGGFLPALREFIVKDGWKDDEKIKCFLEEHTPSQDRGGSGSGGLTQDNPALELVELVQRFCVYGDAQKKFERPTVRIDKQQMVLLCRLDNDKLIKEICRLVKVHGRARKISSFMKFDVLPHMSSGEMSFLTFFARLYHFVGKVQECENVVVFLDEVETTLHPEWQRCLVEYCIRFFEVFLPYRKYQLVFASHSPMLLSDIPKGNVCCLFKDRKGRCSVRSIEADNTFAANIYDLFDSSYFLTGGPLGGFAQAKIRGLAKKNDEKIVALVGDELLKRLLQRRALCAK